MGQTRTCVRTIPNPLAADVWTPLRVALAWLASGGDNEFVEKARNDCRFDDPAVSAGCLGDEMALAGCIIESPIDFGPRRAKLAKNYDGRLRQLGRDFATPRMERQRCDAHCFMFKFFDLRKFLESRINEAWIKVGKHIADGKLRARGAAIDNGDEKPAGDIPASAITETMIIDHEGLVHQRADKSSRAWTSVTVSWRDFIKCLGEPSSGAKPISHAPPSTAKAKSRCRKWLAEVMKASPHERTETQGALFPIALDKFPGLSRRGFDAAWKEAADAVNAHIWVKGGRPKKIPQ